MYSSDNNCSVPGNDKDFLLINVIRPSLGHDIFSCLMRRDIFTGN